MRVCAGFCRKRHFGCQLAIFDESGREVQKLIDNKNVPEGMQQLTFQLPQVKYEFELVQGIEKQRVKVLLYQSVDNQ